MEKTAYKNEPTMKMTAIDAFGNAVGEIKQDEKASKKRQVGLFYFIWHGQHDVKGLYRFDEMLEKYSIEELSKEDSPFYKEPWGAPFYWAEPLFGFYNSLDEWVVRRHIELFTLASVDFLVFDATNTKSFINEALLVMKTIDHYHKRGFHVPKVMFYTHTDCKRRVEEIYNEIYQKKLYPDTWFLMSGKPAIAGNLEDISIEMKDYFTVKTAQWPNEDMREGGFPWMDFAYPQRIFSNGDGSESVVNVSVAQNSASTARFGDSLFYDDSDNRGRSYHDGAHHISENSWLDGANFREQWDRAISLDPDYIFVTGWNEWTAGVWRGEKSKPVAIYDCINGEYSRDIEPMMKGYSDKYYVMMIENIRRYKANSFEMKISQKPLGSLLSGWEVIEKIKIFPNSETCLISKQIDREVIHDAGRNDFAEIAVSHDEDYWYFYAKTASEIITHDNSGEWMSLLIFTNDGEKCSLKYKCCFYESDFLIVETKTDIIKQIAGEYYRDSMVYSVSKKLLPEAFFVKWIDSTSDFEKQEDFYLKGSCAPAGPFHMSISS